MAGLRLYYDLMSQPSRAVYLFLKVNRIPFTSNPVALRKAFAPNLIFAVTMPFFEPHSSTSPAKLYGEHLGEEYAKVNPFRLVPVIDDHGFKLSESVAILKYLAEKYQVADHWYPKDLQKRAYVDRFMSWQHLNLRLFGSMVFRSQIIEPRITGEPVNMAKLKRFQDELEVTLDKIERIFLHDNPYVCGNDLTIGDLLGICELMQPVAVGHDVFTGRPKLEAWASRVKERLQPHFDEAHVHIVKVKEHLRSKV